jgi:hypothetical protein
MGDARNISRQAFIYTLHRLEEKYSDQIVIINNMIEDAVSNIKFSVCVTNDNIPDIDAIRFNMKQYYRHKGYGVEYLAGGGIKILWDIESLPHLYNEEERKSHIVR